MDIVDELRARPSELAHRAADEIERLRRATRLRVVQGKVEPFDGDNADQIATGAIVPLAPNWGLPHDWGHDAEALGWQPLLILKEAERYRQYWTTGKGAGSRKSLRGWRQAWSNWLSKAERYGTR